MVTKYTSKVSIQYDSQKLVKFVLQDLFKVVWNYTRGANTSGIQFVVIKSHV